MSSQSTHATAWRLLALQTILGTCLQVQAQQTPPVLGFFLIDSEPKSLEASVVAVNSHITPPFTYDHNPVTTLVIDCPKAPSQDNNACRAVGIYPAQVYHTQGSIYRGETTFPGDNSTTSWTCVLGEGWTLGQTSSATRSGESADCSKTIESGGATRTEATVFDTCYKAAHSVPLVLTAGAEKIDQYEVDHYLTHGADWWREEESSELTSMACPSTRQTLWIADGTTTGAGSSSTTGAGASASRTTAPATATPSGTGAAGSQSVNGSASVTARPGGNAAVSVLRVAPGSRFCWGMVILVLSNACL